MWQFCHKKFSWHPHEVLSLLFAQAQSEGHGCLAAPARPHLGVWFPRG